MDSATNHEKCRLCLKEKSCMKNIFEYGLKNSDLNTIECVYWMFGVEIDCDDGKSKYICNKCLNLIELIAKYRKLFQENQLFWNNLTSSNVQISSPPELTVESVEDNSALCIEPEMPNLRSIYEIDPNYSLNRERLSRDSTLKYVRVPIQSLSYLQPFVELDSLEKIKEYEQITKITYKKIKKTTIEKVKENYLNVKYATKTDNVKVDNQKLEALKDYYYLVNTSSIRELIREKSHFNNTEQVLSHYPYIRREEINENNLFTTTEKSVFVCEYCSASFTILYYLKHHLRYKHRKAFSAEENSKNHGQRKPLGVKNKENTIPDENEDADDEDEDKSSPPKTFNKNKSRRKGKRTRKVIESSEEECIEAKKYDQIKKLKKNTTKESDIKVKETTITRKDDLVNNIKTIVNSDVIRENANKTTLKNNIKAKFKKIVNIGATENKIKRVKGKQQRLAAWRANRVLNKSSLTNLRKRTMRHNPTVLKPSSTNKSATNEKLPIDKKNTKPNNSNNLRKTPLAINAKKSKEEHRSLNDLLSEVVNGFNNTNPKPVIDNLSSNNLDNTKSSPLRSEFPKDLKNKPKVANIRNKVLIPRKTRDKIKKKKLRIYKSTDIDDETAAFLVEMKNEINEEMRMHWRNLNNDRESEIKKVDDLISPARQSELITTHDPKDESIPKLSPNREQPYNKSFSDSEMPLLTNEEDVKPKLLINVRRLNDLSDIIPKEKSTKKSKWKPFEGRRKRRKNKKTNFRVKLNPVRLKLKNNLTSGPKEETKIEDVDLLFDIKNILEDNEMMKDMPAENDILDGINFTHSELASSSSSLMHDNSGTSICSPVINKEYSKMLNDVLKFSSHPSTNTDNFNKVMGIQKNGESNKFECLAPKDFDVENNQGSLVNELDKPLKSVLPKSRKHTSVKSKCASEKKIYTNCILYNNKIIDVKSEYNINYSKTNIQPVVLLNKLEHKDMLVKNILNQDLSEAIEQFLNMSL
ncbi:unnamed protein product [Brassicogethes aeneus]|uniref:C2H2-type domain-containing protein n=1 Tax=Brassicogethes aeneus TaxID=1431903 RepID=A0A9P0AWM9_BRAAE|nr:unnamed protein product [Brassicogethes aeneus]